MPTFSLSKTVWTSIPKCILQVEAHGCALQLGLFWFYNINVAIS